MSGVSHRSISPSPLSSVRLATTGVTTTCVSPSWPGHAHWMSGSKLSGGAASVHGTFASMASTTLHRSTGAPVLPVSSPRPVSPGSPLLVAPLLVAPLLMASPVDPPGPALSPVGRSCVVPGVLAGAVGTVGAAVPSSPIPSSPQPPRPAQKARIERRRSLRCATVTAADDSPFAPHRGMRRSTLACRAPAWALDGIGPRCDMASHPTGGTRRSTVVHATSRSPRPGATDPADARRGRDRGHDRPDEVPLGSGRRFAAIEPICRPFPRVLAPPCGV